MESLHYTAAAHPTFTGHSITGEVVRVNTWQSLSYNHLHSIAHLGCYSWLYYERGKPQGLLRLWSILLTGNWPNCYR